MNNDKSPVPPQDEQRYRLGQEVFTIDAIQQVRSFVVGAVCVTNGFTVRKVLYAPQTFKDHGWTSEELLYPNAEEAIKDGISKLKAQLKQ